MSKRLCGKCGALANTTYIGNCSNCGEYHGEWYDGFKSLEELEAWRAANVPPESRALAASLKDDLENRIRQSDRELSKELGVDVTALMDSAYRGAKKQT